MAAAYAAYRTLLNGDGVKSIIGFLMFAAGAAIAGFTIRCCFSPKRTFGDFIQAVEGSDADVPPERPGVRR